MRLASRLPRSWLVRPAARPARAELRGGPDVAMAQPAAAVDQQPRRSMQPVRVARAPSAIAAQTPIAQDAAASSRRSRTAHPAGGFDQATWSRTLTRREGGARRASDFNDRDRPVRESSSQAPRRRRRAPTALRRIVAAGPRSAAANVPTTSPILSPSARTSCSVAAASRPLTPAWVDRRRQLPGARSILPRRPSGRTWRSRLFTGVVQGRQGADTLGVLQQEMLHARHATSRCSPSCDARASGRPALSAVDTVPVRARSRKAGSRPTPRCSATSSGS